MYTDALRTLTITRQDNLVNGNKATLLAHLRSIWEQPETLQERLDAKVAELAIADVMVLKHQAALADFDGQNPEVTRPTLPYPACIRA